MAKNQDITIESSLPIVQINGLQTNKAAYFDSTVEINGAATFDTTANFTGAASFASIAASGAISSGSTITATGAISTVAGLTTRSGTVIPLGPTGTQVMAFTSTSTFGIFAGNGRPTFTGATGSLYVNYGGTGVESRLFVNTGGTGWTGFTSVS